MLHSILNTFTCCSRYSSCFFRARSFPFYLKKTSSHGHESTVQTVQILATAGKVCSHCVSRMTLHMLAMVPLLHPSKVILDACMLHQEELTGEFKYTRWLSTVCRCASTLANHPRPSLHNTAENQNTRPNSEPMRLVGESLCVWWGVQGSWTSLI